MEIETSQVVEFLFGKDKKSSQVQKVDSF